MKVIERSPIGGEGRPPSFGDRIISMNLELIRAYLTKDLTLGSMPSISSSRPTNYYDRSTI